MELVIVLVLIGLLASIVVSSFNFRGGGHDLRKATAEISAGLRATRSLSMSSGLPAEFELDLRNRNFRVGAGSSRNISDAIEITFITAEREVIGSQKGIIRFFPSGGATGGRILLKTRSGSKPPSEIQVDWVTGRVSHSP